MEKEERAALTDLISQFYLSFDMYHLFLSEDINHKGGDKRG
jgi:hypothetical protein